MTPTFHPILVWLIIFLIIAGWFCYAQLRIALSPFDQLGAREGTRFTERLRNNPGVCWLIAACLSYDFPVLWYFSIYLSAVLFLIAITLLIRDLDRYVAQRKAIRHRPRLHPVSLSLLLFVMGGLIWLNVRPQLEHDLDNNPSTAYYGWPHDILRVPRGREFPYEQLVSVEGLIVLFVNAAHWILIIVATLAAAEWLLTRFKRKTICNNES